MGKIKAIIFDMDGVLVDAKEWHYESLNRALSLFGYQISRYDHVVTYDGLPTRKKLEMITLERGLPSGLHTFINELKQQYTMELVHAKCKPVFPREFALSKLKEYGYHIVVCSNSIKNTVDIMLEKSNLSEYLTFTLSNQDVEHPKPHPEIYTKAIKRLELKPEECLIVEDNENGIIAAQKSGAFVMTVKDISEVNLENIMKNISKSEAMK